jgi:hypothetical protein
MIHYAQFFKILLLFFIFFKWKMSTSYRFFFLKKSKFKSKFSLKIKNFVFKRKFFAFKFKIFTNKADCYKYKLKLPKEN